MFSFPSSLLDGFPESELVSLSQGFGEQRERAQLALLNAYRPLLVAAVRGVPPWLMEDAEAEATAAFLLALKRFDPNRGTALAPFAAAWVKGTVYKLVAKELRYASSVPHNMQDEKVSHLAYAESGFELFEFRDLLQRNIAIVGRWMNSLRRRDQDLLQKRFLAGTSQVQIARALGVTPAAVSKRLSALRVQARKEVELEAVR